MADSRVFGTPTEPLFNHRICGVTPDMLQDWMTMLINKNAKIIADAKPCFGSAITSDSVQFLFLTCEKLKMSDEVKYLSLELFDRFMLKHMQDLHEHVIKSSSLTRNKAKDWTEIKSRVSNQVILRVVSCIQIASKLTSHYRILSPNKVRRFLTETGHRYNTESILQSELRILKTLDFNVSLPSPLVYLEAILEVLGQSDMNCEVKVLHGVSLKLLDLVYCDYYTVYGKLHEMVAKGSPITDKARESFTSVRTDKMLLMVSIITAAAYILDRDTHKEVMAYLSKITYIPADDIGDFSSVMIQTLLGDED